MSTRTVPVAWMVKSSHSGDEIEIELFQQPFDAAEFAHKNGGIVFELYAAAPPQPEPTDHLADPDSRERARNALRAITNAGSIGQAKRIAMQALGDTNAAPEQSERESITSPSQEGCAVGTAPAAAPITSSEAVSACPRCGKTGTALNDGHGCFAIGTIISGATSFSGAITIGLTGASGFVTNNATDRKTELLMTNAGGTNIIAPMPDAPAAAVSSAEAYAMDCEGYAVPAAPTTMNLGKRQESALPLSELVIESHRSYLLDRSLMLDSYIQSPYMQEVANKLCDQAMRAIELEQRVKEAESNAAFDSRLAAERGEKLAEAMQTARDKLLGWEQAEARCKELERHLKAQAEQGVNQFDRAEKAMAEVAAARQRERERCAAVCEGTFSPMTSPTGCCDAALDKAAAAIRALTDD